MVVFIFYQPICFGSICHINFALVVCLVDENGKYICKTKRTTRYTRNNEVQICIWDLFHWTCFLKLKKTTSEDESQQQPACAQ